jgi:serine/threonine-protein kinase RsbW
VDDVEIKMVLFLPHEAASVPVSRQVLDGCLQTLGVTPDTRADIALALTEACANVIQHARSDDQYEVQVRARNGRCAIEVVNAGSGNGEPAPYRGEDDEGWAGAMALSSDPVPGTAEHGRGLKIINAVVDNLQLTGNEREGRTVHFEKTLDWLPGAAGQHLSRVDGGGEAQPGPAASRSR